MFNFTQTVSPDVIDITPMVIMVLFFAICYLISDAMLSYDNMYTNKKNNRHTSQNCIICNWCFDYILYYYK